MSQIQSAMMQLAEYGLADRYWDDETIKIELSPRILKNRAPMRKRKPDLSIVGGAV